MVDLLYFEGYYHIEAAKVLTIPLGIVKTRVYHAWPMLRKIMVETEVIAGLKEKATEQRAP